MPETPGMVPATNGATAPKRSGRLKPIWRAIRKPIASSRIVKTLLTSLFTNLLRFVYWTNRRVDRTDVRAVMASHGPAIIALWHGQHILTQCFYPKDLSLVAMFSRSADAELNARVFEKFGFTTVRGSGGRGPERGGDKGGAAALIALKKALEGGNSVAMIADIPHGTPRDAGLGIVTLARLSGRPILPAAVATSRRKVLEKSWDKTTINLPFGRSALVFGEPIEVPADADRATWEDYRRKVTQGIDAVTLTAQQLVDRQA